MLNLRQKELHEWQLKNFGKHDDDLDAVYTGMCEEFGELSHAKLKYRQKIREYANGNGEIKEILSDAFGDMMIYGLQVMTECNIDAYECVHPDTFVFLSMVIKDKVDYYKLMSQMIGNIGSELSTNSISKIIIMRYFSGLYFYGTKFLEQYNINGEEAVNKTIDTVLKRNWKDNPAGIDIDKGSEEGK